jgi:hypothetical protein
MTRRSPLGLEFLEDRLTPATKIAAPILPPASFNVAHITRVVTVTAPIGVQLGTGGSTGMKPAIGLPFGSSGSSGTGGSGGGGLGTSTGDPVGPGPGN